MRLGIICAILVLLAGVSGCVTHRDKVAVVRGSMFAGSVGTELGAAVADELSQVAADIGADSIDPATVVLTADAARANAAGIAAERGARQALFSLVAKGASWLGSSVPWLAPALGFGAAAFEWLRRRKAQLATAKAGEIVGVLGRAVGAVQEGKPLGDVLRSEAKALVNISTVDVARAVEDAKAGEL